MKKLILILTFLLLPSLCFSGSIQDKHRAVIARKNAGGGAVYTFSECFEDETDGTALEDNAVWTLVGGTAGTITYENTVDSDEGSCTAGTTMSAFIDTAGAGSRTYTATFTPGGNISTIAFELYLASEQGDNTSNSFLYVQKSDGTLVTILNRYTNSGGDDDLRLSYDSDNEGTSDSYIVICAACLPATTWVSIEVVFTAATYQVTSVWVDGTEYDTGWNVTHEQIGKLQLSSYAQFSPTDLYIDSLRVYDGDRNASY